MANKRRITISVDFGTTYSGAAYHYVDDGYEVSDMISYNGPANSDQTGSGCHPIMIKNWDVGSLSQAKVPTVIRYNASDHVGGVFGFKWGNQVKHHERRQEWFKLKLDPMAYISPDTVDFERRYPSLLAEPRDSRRSAIQLCTDYLKELRKQIWKSLENSISAAALKTFRVDWVITVPAIWSDKARSDTLQCAREAGIGSGNRLTIISEPEAAAAYAFQMIKPLGIEVNDNVVVCDVISMFQLY
jgi:molecular chaperone DnaK (HSP70)